MKAPEYILYPSEDPSALRTLTKELTHEYQPADAAESEIVEQLIIAAWLRRRYEKVRTALYDTLHELERNEPNSPRLHTTTDSIQRFQLEVDRQRKYTTVLRRSLRRLRTGETNEANSLDGDQSLAPAA